MARLDQRLPANIEGNFFVDSSCIDCDACRQFAPTVFARRGEQSAVVHQPATDGEQLAAGKALVSCPTASIGTIEKTELDLAINALPEQVDEQVWRCGFTSEKSFGAFSYLIADGGRGVLVDTPRFSRRLARNIEQITDVQTIALTHVDDVADHSQWAERFAAKRVIHDRDARGGLRDIELLHSGDEPIEIVPGLIMIPTPGHTAGHSVFLYRDRYLFTGDHLWWSPRRRSLHASRGVCWFDWDEQIESMKRLLELEFEWVLPGHGRPVHIPASRMKNELQSLVERMQRQR